MSSWSSWSPAPLSHGCQRSWRAISPTKDSSVRLQLVFLAGPITVRGQDFADLRDLEKRGVKEAFENEICGWQTSFSAQDYLDLYLPEESDDLYLPEESDD